MASHHIFISESNEQTMFLILIQDSSRNKVCPYIAGITGSQMRFAA